MTGIKRLLWIAAAAIAVANCALYVSRATKAPDKVAASTAQSHSAEAASQGADQCRVRDLGGRQCHGYRRPLGSVQRRHAHVHGEALA